MQAKHFGNQDFLVSSFLLGQRVLLISSSSGFRSKADLTARILRTNITKLDLLESNMIMRMVAVGLPDVC